MTAVVVMVTVGGLVAPSVTAHAATRAALIAPVITDVDGRDGEVRVTVTLGDSDDRVDRVDVSAYAVDDNGDPTGNSVATGNADRPAEMDPVEVTVNGLTNDTKYAFVATQTSGGKTSDKSAPPYLGGPDAAEAPLAPMLRSVYGRDQSLAVTWDPASDDGSPVTGYTITAEPGGQAVSAAGTDTTATITGLTNGTRYTVTVTATNKAGTGRPGTSDFKTLGADQNGTVAPAPAYAPGPPTDVAVAPPAPDDGHSTGNQTQLKVHWNAPDDDGGSPITGYTVQATADGQPTVTKQEGPGPNALLTGLVADVTYQVTVTAHNATSRSALNRAATSESSTAATGVKMNPDAVVLSSASVGKITTVTPTKVIFNHPTDQVKALKKDKIVVVGKNDNRITEGSGLLRKVTDVKTSGDKLTLTTVDSAIDEIMGDVDLTAAPDDAAMKEARITNVAPGYRASIISRTKDGWVIDLGKKITSDPRLKDKLPKGTKVTAKLNVGLTVTPDWKVTAGWQKDPRGWWHGSTFTWDFKAAATAKASVKGQIGISYKHQFDKQKVFEVEQKSCTWIYVVAFCPRLAVYAQVTLDGSITFSFVASYQRKVGGRLWRAADTSLHSEDLTTNPTSKFGYTLQAKAKITVDFPVELEILVYKVVGPKLTVTPSLILAADTAANPWLRLDLGVKVRLDFVVDFKVKRFSWGDTVYDGTVRLWDSQGPFRLPSLSPMVSQVGSGHRVAAEPIPLTVQWPANCTQHGNVTWSLMPGSGGTIHGNGVYDPPSGDTDSLNVIMASTEATADCPATTVYAAVHTGDSTPGQPVDVKYSSDGHKITWSPPTDLGGKPITKYAVLVEHDEYDETADDYVLGPSSDTKLSIPDDKQDALDQPGVRVSVIAFTSEGQGPPSDQAAPPQRPSES
ncbi:fibronectin type III domain-containing protein [Actinocrispum wychmicini]|nr:fibronectin type III domain-containing protein [Actinocrispum wychmicini]